MSCMLQDLDRHGQLFLRDGAGEWMAMRVTAHQPGVIVSTVLTMHACHALLMPKRYAVAQFSPVPLQMVVYDYLLNQAVPRVGYSILDPVDYVLAEVEKGGDVFALLESVILESVANGLRSTGTSPHTKKR